MGMNFAFIAMCELLGVWLCVLSNTSDRQFQYIINHCPKSRLPASWLYFLLCLEKPDLILFYDGTLGDWSSLYDWLMQACNPASKAALLIAEYNTGGLSSGLHAEETRRILCQDARFNNNFDELEIFLVLTTTWVAAYTPTIRGPPKRTGGVFSWHGDGNYRGSHRLITSLGCKNKSMWIRGKGSTSKSGFRLKHGATVVFSRVGGGVTRANKHRVTDAINTWTIGNEGYCKY
jgi:hypothetical protein